MWKIEIWTDFGRFRAIFQPNFEMVKIANLAWNREVESRNAKKTNIGWKKKSKNRGKIFFFRNGHNLVKVSKKAQKSIFGPILLDLQSFFDQILRWPKSPIFDYVSGLSHFGRFGGGQNRGQSHQKSKKVQNLKNRPPDLRDSLGNSYHHVTGFWWTVGSHLAKNR